MESVAKWFRLKSQYRGQYQPCDAESEETLLSKEHESRQYVVYRPGTARKSLAVVFLTIFNVGILALSAMFFLRGIAMRSPKYHLEQMSSYSTQISAPVI